MTAPQNYDHKTRESHWQQEWETKQVYAWRGDQSREQTYVIDTPPPTVSGQLHMGHIFSYAHADFIARYQRMKGKDVFYPMGFDDNGLPTERLVEKTKKIRATDVSRETFISLCEVVSREARKEFRDLFSSSALSVDWKLEYHTISEDVRRISQASFIDLYQRGQVSRRLQPMLWDPVDQTAIAQAEVEDREMAGVFCDIRFTVEGGGEFVIGTTRPEMLPACVAIFYHPNDVRYQYLKGRQAITPLFGMRVPILEDESVEPDKGTGIMMCCTFGDEADIVKWRKHGLETKIILNKYGKIESENVPQLQGLKATAAREKMMELLDASGDLVGKKPITHAVKCAERSGAPLEILPTQQWFVNVLEHKEALKQKSAECDWKPEWMAKRMEQWIDGLNWDWCISRQRYYGVPFPVWYKRERGTQQLIDRIVAETTELPVDPLRDYPSIYKSDRYIVKEQSIDLNDRIHGKYWIIKDSQTNEEFELDPDFDVMDTWATSSLTPQISAWGATDSVIPAQAGIQPLTDSLDSRLRGNDDVADSQFPTPNSRSEALFPADLRPQAHEIIRTWAFYTLAKAHLHHDSIPWKHLMISGWCLASDKTKMSKSKGNVVTPKALLEAHSADAVRYWASTSRLGADTAFSEEVLKIGRKLVNKLWNATKFVMGMMESGNEESGIGNQEFPGSGFLRFQMLDRWMLSRVHHAIAAADACFAAYDYAGARAAVEDVFWNDFCDNYLELVKARAYGNMGEEGKASAIAALSASLNALLKLFAPFVPHIAEELYHLAYPLEAAEKGSVHARGNWPDSDAYLQDAEADAAGAAAVAVLELIRKAKSGRGVSIKYPIDVIYLTGADAAFPETVAEDFKAAGTVAECFLSAAPGAVDVSLADEAKGYHLSVIFAKEASVA